MPDCRSCLSADTSPLTDTDLIEVLNLCVNVDGYQLFICKSCKAMLSKFHAFREKARSVDELFRKGYDDGALIDELLRSEDIGGQNCLINDSSEQEKSEEQTCSRLERSDETEDYDFLLSPIQTEAAYNTDGLVIDSAATNDVARRVRKRGKTGDRHVCEQCGYIARDTTGLTVHIRSHTGERPFPCPHCDKSFTTSGNLNAHKRMHSGAKPYVCDQCGGRFTAAQTLREHARAHAGERPYRCGVCQRTFANRSNCRLHARRHGGERRHACGVCARSFRTSWDVRAHLATHSSVRPHPCAHCGRRFAARSNLRAHVANAHAQRPLTPCLCGETFTNKKERASHMRKHRKEGKPQQLEHICEVCGKRFSRRYNLAAHKKRMTCKPPEDSTNQVQANIEPFASENQTWELGRLANESAGVAPPTNQTAASFVTTPNVIVHSQQRLIGNIGIENVPQLRMFRLPTGATAGQRLAGAVTTVLPVTLLPLSILK